MRPLSKWVIVICACIFIFQLAGRHSSLAALEGNDYTTDAAMYELPQRVRDREKLSHRKRQSQWPSIVSTYTLVDLGETDLPISMLTRFHDGLSLAPAISNSGKIIGNHSTGGFVYYNENGRYTPRIKGVRIFLHQINAKESILLSIRRGPFSVEWFVWPTLGQWDTVRLPIDTVEQEGYKVNFVAINDSDVVVGEVTPYEHSMPLVWTPEKGLYRVGHGAGLNLLGKIKALNGAGSIVGKYSGKQENFPFFWDGQQLTNFFNYRKQFCCPPDGKMEFEDLVVSSDHTVYGTYWINKHFLESVSHHDEEYRAFQWSPDSNKIALIDLEGMRFSAISHQKRLVGAIDGQAAFCDAGERPMKLIAAMAQESVSGWNLLEACDINDLGQIVGFGRKGDKMHLFLANPL